MPLPLQVCGDKRAIWAMWSPVLTLFETGHFVVHSCYARLANPQTFGDFPVSASPPAGEALGLHILATVPGFA